MNELDELLDQILGPPPLHAGEGLDSSVWSALEAAGLMRVGLSESLGGVGGSRAEAARIVIRCAESGLAVPVAESVLIGAALADCSGLALPAGLIGCALSRPAASIVAAPAGNGWQLTGLPAGLAGTVIALADVDDSSALVAVFDAGAVAGSAVVSREVARDISLVAALATACELTGACRTAFGLALDYASTRTQFGRRLDEQQVIRHALAELAGELALTEAATSVAVARASESDPLDAGARLAILTARVQAARAATKIAATAHQLHGAIGLTREHPLHHFTTRLWAGRDAYGTEHEWAMTLASGAATADSLWQSLTSPSKPH